MTDNNYAEPYSLETVAPPEDAVQSEDEDDAAKWYREQQQMLIDEARGIKRFHTIDSDVLFEKQLEKRKYIVEGLLPEGLTLLSGDPKTGKSFFALSLSVSVAKGEPFLCFPTTKSEVLYFSFEDDEKRLQQRLFEMSDETFQGLTFSSDVLRLGEGFIETLEDYLQKHPKTKLVVVDTLNYIRPAKQGNNMYRDDYDDMVKLHRLTQQFSIAMLILHHNKKGDEEDVLRAISGSMGIAGGTDNIIVISQPKNKGETVSTMHVVSRDMGRFSMKIVQGDNGVWTAAEDKTVSEKEISVTVRAVYLFYTLTHFSDEPLRISPTELSDGINELFSITIPSNMIKKNLTADHEDLEALGLKFEYERSKKEGRKLVFHEVESYRKPKYYYFDENGKFVFDAFFALEYEDDAGDSGDRVTAETDIENDPSSAVTADAATDETIVETGDSSAANSSDNRVSDSSENYSGDSSDVLVTADSRCETSCHPVTPSPNDVKSGSGQKQNGGKKKKKKSKKKPKKKR